MIVAGSLIVTPILLNYIMPGLHCLNLPSILQNEQKVNQTGQVWILSLFSPDARLLILEFLLLCIPDCDKILIQFGQWEHGFSIDLPSLKY